MASGRIQHLCLLTGEGAATPAGLARAINGSYTIDSGAVTMEGIGNTMRVGKGVLTATLEIEAVGMLKTELVKFFPSADTVVALSAMLLVTDTGALFKLENGAGGNASISVSADDKSFVSVKCTAQFGKVTEGTGTPVYLTTLGHQRKHVYSTIDTADGGIHTFDFSNGLTLKEDNPLDERAVGSENSVAGWAIDTIAPTLTTELAEALDATDLVEGDADGEYVPHDIVITLDNGEATEDLAFTFTDWIAPVHKGNLQAQGVTYYSYEWQRGDGDIMGRLTVA